MAKITAGPLVGSVRGALGGVVFRGAGSSATVQMKGRARRGSTPAQDLQRQAMAEAAARWVEMDPRAQGTWNEFASQGLPPAGVTGAAVKSGRQAWIQFRVAQFLCGTLTDYWWPLVWPYRAAGAVTLTLGANPGGACLLQAYFPGPPGGIALAAARCPSTARYAGRPIYRPIWTGATDGAPAWVYHAETPYTPWHADLSAGWQANFPTARAGELYQVRQQMTNNVTMLAPAPLTVIAVE